MEVTIADLARERINILDIKQLGGEWIASIEYQYNPKNQPHTWHKVIVAAEKEEAIIGEIWETVKAAKAELER